MSYGPRFHVLPQLEVIRASDDTVRAELIALPLVRTELGDVAIEDPAAAAAVASGERRRRDAWQALL